MKGRVAFIDSFNSKMAILISFTVGLARPKHSNHGLRKLWFRLASRRLVSKQYKSTKTITCSTTETALSGSSNLKVK